MVMQDKELVETIGSRLREGLKILVIGVKASNIRDSDLSTDPRVITWDTTDPKCRSKTELPKDVGVVINTRFFRSHQIKKLKSRSNGRVLFFSKLSGTGEIRNLLDPILASIPFRKEGGASIPLEPQKVAPAHSIPVIPQAPTILEPRHQPEKDEEEDFLKPKPKRRKLGVISGFIRSNADFNAPSSAELDRLVMLASSGGIDIPRDRIIKEMSRQRLLQKAARPKAPAASRIPRMRKPKHEAAALLEKLADDMTLGAVAAHELLDEIGKLKEENKKLKAENKEMEGQLRAFKKNLRSFLKRK